LRPRRRFCVASYAGWLTVHVRQHQREVGPVSRGVMSQPLSAPLQSGIRFLPPPLPAAPTAHLAVRFPEKPPGRQRAYHVPPMYQSGLGRVSTPVIEHLRGRSSEPPNLTTYRFGPGLSASYWPVLCDDACDASPGLTLPPILGPDRLDAGSRHRASRSGDLERSSEGSCCPRRHGQGRPTAP